MSICSDVDRNPREQRLDVRALVLRPSTAGRSRRRPTRRTTQHHRRREVAARGLAEPATEQQDEQEPDERERGDQPDDVEHRYPFLLIPELREVVGGGTRAAA